MEHLLDYLRKMFPIYSDIRIDTSKNCCALFADSSIEHLNLFDFRIFSP